jgi:uncharacterized membrane protein HdeD (DUF308 family)
MSKNTNENKLDKRQPNVTMVVITISCIFIMMGLLLLFVPQIQMITIAYVFSAVAIVLGIIMIVKYFLMEAYHNMNQYGFSVGSLFVIIGVCAMVKAEAVSQYFLLCMGILILVSAMVKLQNALDLKALEYKIWSIFLGIAVVMLICAIVIILNPFSKAGDLEHFTYIILVADGALGLISTLFLYFQVRRYDKSMVQFENSVKEMDPVDDEITKDVPQDETEAMEEKNEKI